MLQRLKSILPQKLFGSAPSRAGGPGADLDLPDMIEQLHEIAGELDVVITAFQSTEFSRNEAFGLCLILRRQTNRIKHINAEICASG
ncbi:MAG: hypothetical protein AAF936_09340 [Pseudomonadota bacterium]